MNIVNTILILVTALLVVFIEVAWNGARAWLGTQVDLLPGLMVYASLRAGITAVTLLALVGGLCFDALSANPVGVTILPLFAVGLVIQRFQHLILRDQVYAQWVLGLGASATAPLLSLLLSVTAGSNPLVGLGSLWQWLVVSLVGAAFTPLCFRVLGRVERALSYRPFSQTSFRPDRELERGRH